VSIGEETVAKMAADETCAAGDENVHGCGCYQVVETISLVLDMELQIL
jgi:hypothetical protein